VTNIPADQLGDRLTVPQLMAACAQIDERSAEIEKARRGR
jgi:hypothetical protein